jgi:hypothetical protein
LELVGDKIFIDYHVIAPTYIGETQAIMPGLFKRRGGELDLITLTELASNIEISSSSPYVVYGGGLETANSGLLYYSFTGTSGSFSPRLAGFTSGYVYDARSFRESGGSGIGFKTLFTQNKPYSGYSDVSYLEEAGINAVYPIETFHTFSGQSMCLETTNNYDFPFIFVSTSGDRYRFYQQDGVRRNDIPISGFVDRTFNLPNSRIKVIRCDDIL